MNNETSYTQNPYPNDGYAQPNAVPPNYVPPYPPPVYPNTAYPVQPVYAVKPKREYSFSQKLFALAMVWFGYLYMRVFCFEAGNVGKTVFVLLLLLISAGYMVHCGVRPNTASVVAGVLTGVLSLAFVFGLTGGLQFWLTVVCQLCYTYFVYKAYDTSIECGPGRFFDFDMLRAVFAAPFSSFGSVFPAVFSTSGDKNKRFSKKLGLILLGLLISIIPTGIVVVLLSYDSGFTALLDKVLGIDLLEGSLFSHVLSLLLGLPIAMYMYGLWTSCTFRVCKEASAADCAQRRERTRFLPQILAFAALMPTLFVYLLFFISQFQYYTAAFTGVLPEGYSYAEYARSGFFELCAVMVINSILVFLLFLLVKTGGRDGIARLYTALLSISMLILAATAASKMLLYVNECGLTVRRTYTLWFMLTIALVFLVLLVKTILPKLPFVPIALSVVMVMFGVLTLSNAPARISDYNTQQILDGKSWELDVSYFEQLGDAAVSDAVRLEKAETANEETRSSAADFLDYYEACVLSDEPRLSEYSLSRMQAEQALRSREPYVPAEE